MRADERPGMLITRLEKDERAKWEAKQLAQQARADAAAVKREEAEQQRNAFLKKHPNRRDISAFGEANRRRSSMRVGEILEDTAKLFDTRHVAKLLL